MSICLLCKNRKLEDDVSSVLPAYVIHRVGCATYLIHSFFEFEFLQLDAMLPEPTTRLERSHLRLTFNRSLSEPGSTAPSSTSSSNSNSQDHHLQLPMSDQRQHQKRLYMQLQHHHNQVHLHQHSKACSSLGSSSQSSVSSCSTSSSICSIDKDELDEEQPLQPLVLLQQQQQSPAKRCCLGLPLSVSLPSSPSSESSSLQRAVMAKRTRIYTADQLAAIKWSNSTPTSPTTGQPVVIVDCRPFMAYNASHVRGAINLNCSDRWNRKRLQTGRVSLADLATSPEGKDLLRRRTVKEVIVYDDGAVDCERLPPSSTLYIVLSALLDDHKEPLLLAGKRNILFSTLPYFFLLFWQRERERMSTHKFSQRGLFPSAISLV